MSKLILMLILAAGLSHASNTFTSSFNKIQAADESGNIDIPCCDSSNNNPSFIAKDDFAFHWLEN